MKMEKRSAIGKALQSFCLLPFVAFAAICVSGSGQTFAPLKRAMAEGVPELPEKTSRESRTAEDHETVADEYTLHDKHEEALKEYGKVLAIREKTLGKNHPDTIKTCGNIAWSLQRQGRYEDALEWYSKVLEYRKKTWGEEELDTIGAYGNISSVYNDLAGFHEKTGQYEKALEWRPKALAIDQKASGGEEYINISEDYLRIAKVYHRLNKYEDALEWHRKALATEKKVCEDDLKQTGQRWFFLTCAASRIAAIHNLTAGIYKDQGRHKEALAEYLSAYRFLLKSRDEDDEDDEEVRPMLKNIKAEMKKTHKKTGDGKPFDQWLADALKKPR